jgi:hypothetical protein
MLPELEIWSSRIRLRSESGRTGHDPGDGTKTRIVVDVYGAGGLRGESLGHRLRNALAPEEVIFIVSSFTNG